MNHGRRIAVLGVILCLCAPLARGDDAPALPDFAVANRLVPEDPMPERETKWSRPGVTLTDVVYATLPGYRPLHLDLYRSVANSGPVPLVVFLHGGAWAYANPRAGAAFRNFPTILANLAERGYAVASVEYRFAGEAPFPAQVEDVRAAIRFLRQNAARLGIDGSRVGLWGMSAGAHLAGMQAMNCSDDTCVQGWVGWFGIYDFSTASPDEPNLRLFLGCGAQPCPKTKIEAASPIQFVDGRDPPALLLHGTADELPPSNSEELVKRLREAGASAELVLLSGVHHGMVGPTDATTKAALRQSLATTFAFFDRTLRDGPGSPPGPGPKDSGEPQRP